MKNNQLIKKLLLVIALLILKQLVYAQSNHTVVFSGNTSDFNAAEKYTSVDNVDYYVTYDATYIYFGAFRNGGNAWGTFDHFTVYIDNFGVGAGSATGVNWDGNTPTLPFAADYRIAIRNNSAGESFFSSYSGSWTTGAANAQGWNQYTTASADGALEVRIPWIDIGNPNAIRFLTYASYNTGYFGYAPSGTSGTGPSGATQWFGNIGTKSDDCIPTNTTNLALTGTGTLTNTVPAAGGTYARVTVNTGTITNANAWTLAPGGILEVTNGTFAIGSQTITFGNAASSNGKGTTINTSGTGSITTVATSVLTFGGEGNITGNNLSINGTIRIQNKFTPLAAGGLTFNAGAALDIRNNGFININAPTYANASNLNYNTGGAYTAGSEWTSNATSGVGIPSIVNIGNSVASSQLSFGSSSQYRQLLGNLTLSATATLSLSSNIGGDLQIAGSITNAAGSVFNHNSRAVTFNGTAAQNLNSTALTLAYVFISNTTATVTTLANTTILNNLTIDANARLNIAATTLNITGATSAINGFLRSAGTITGASTSTLTINNGGTYEHNYTTTLGVIPTATWNVGSNCNIIGYTTALTATGANGFGQTFSNFTWNCALQAATAFNLASQLTSVNGNLSILSTGTTGTLTLSNTAATIINVGGNIIQSGGTCIESTAATNLNVTGDINISGGTHTITNTAAIVSFLNVTGNVNITGGTFNVSTNTGASQIVVTGNFNQSAGTFNVSTGASGSPQMNVSGDWTLTGGTFNIANGASTAILNVTGTVLNNGGNLVITTGAGAAQLNANSNYNQSAGTTNISNTTGLGQLNVKGDFTFSGGTLTKTVSGVIVGTVTFNGTTNQNINITAPGNITNSVTFRLNNPSGITLLNGSTLPINSLASFRRTLGNVSLIGTGAVVFNATSSTLIYDGAVDVTTGNEWPSSSGPVNVTFAHTALSNISLHASRILPSTGVLNLFVNNRLLLGSNDLTVSNTASAAILPAIGTATQMVVAEGSGKLIRSIAIGIAYTWPIGEMTGTIEYSPVTALNFSASSTARDIGFNVVNGTHPQMNTPDPQAHYRNRYFGVYNSAGGTYTYTATFNYLAADNIGTVANIKLNAYAGGSWSQAPQTTSAVATSLTTVAVSETTFPLTTGADIVGRSKPQVYVWNENAGGTQSWAVAANWTPARNILSFDDILVFSNGGTSTANAIPVQSIGKILMSNNTAVTLVPAVAATLTLTGGAGDDLVVPVGCSLTIGGAPAAVALTIGHLLGAGNTVLIDGTVTTGANLATNTFSATNSNVNINGTFNNNGIFNTTSSTTIINGTFNNIAGTTTTAAANLTFTAGANANHARNGSIVIAATWDVASNCNITGLTNTIPTGLNQTFGNFSWNCTSQSATLTMGANLFTTVNGNLSFLSTNNQILNISATASTLNIGGNLFVDIGTGTLRLPSAAAVNVILNVNGNTTLNTGNISHINTGIATLNFNGDVLFNGGAIIRTAGTSNVNFVKSTGTQTWTQSATLFSGIHNIGIGNGTTTNTLQLLSNFDLTATASPFIVNQNATLDCKTFLITGSSAAFTLSNTVPGATLITANLDGIELTGALGSIQTTGARNYNVNANYIFNASGAQNTGMGFTGANNLTIDNSSNVSLSASAIVSGIISFTNGKLILNNSNLSVFNALGNPFSGITSIKYIVTNGTGEVFRSIATSGLPLNYVYPIGDIINYSPVELNFSANSLTRNIGVIATAGAVPFNLPSSDYINRSWTFTNSAAGTYTYIPNFTYSATDVVGSEANMKLSRFVGPLWTEYNATPNTIITPPSITLSGSLTETTGPLSSYWTGRLYAAPVSYTWNGATSSDWNTASNWTPNGIPGIIDNVLINTAAINPCMANGTFFGANNFNLSGTGNFQLTASSTLSVNGNLTYVNTAIASLNCSSTFNLTTPSSQNVPALNYGNLNLTGGDRVLAATGTIGICGQYTTGSGAITITGSTINYNNTGAQTITATNYNNLTISQNRGTGLITLQPGTITVNATFTPSLSNYTAFVDGNTFNFNGGAGQIIPAFFYFNLTSANATRTWANSGIIDIKGTFSPAATAVNTITNSTIRFSSTLPGINLATYTTNVASRNFANVIFDGVGGSWNAGAANLRPSGSLIVNNGTVNVATAVASILAVGGNTTINGGILNLSSDIGVGTGTFTGAVTINGGTLNLANGTTAAGTATATAAAINVNGGFFVVSNSIAPGTLTQSGILTINGGTFRMTTTSGAATVTISNNLVQTSGSFVRAGSGAASFVFTATLGQTRNWSQGATFTMSGLTTFSVAGLLTTLRITSDVNIGNATVNINSGYFFDAQNFVMSGIAGSIFRCYNGGRFTTQNVGGVALAPAATGSIQTATRFFGGSVIWTFNGSAAQVTGNAFPGSVDAITLNNPSGLTLNVNMRVQNGITLTNGNLILGNFNLTLQAGITIGGGANSATKMIVTNGTGMLVKMFTTTGSYTYPIGDNTGTVEYSPVTLNFTTLSGTPDSIGMRVTDAQHPNDLTISNYISRYWTCDQKAGATYTYTATFRYLDADVVGLESVIRVDRWSNPLSSWNQDAGSTINVGSNTLTTSSGLTEVSGTLLNNDFAGRSNASFYYQTVATGVWSNPSIWEISTDPLFISPAPSTPATAPDALNSLGINIRNGHDVTLNSNTTADEMQIEPTGTLIINAGQTLTLENGAGLDLYVEGAINNAGTIITNGNIQFINGGTYSHDQNGGNIPTATWNASSIATITGVTNTVPTGLNQSFYNFTWQCSNQVVAIHLTDNLTSIQGDFNANHTGTPANDLRLFNNTTNGTLNIGGDFVIAANAQVAIINSASSGSGNATLNIDGSLFNFGILNMTGALSNTAASSSINIKGDLGVYGTGKIIRTQNVPSTITFNAAAGIQSFSTIANGLNTDPILYRVGDGTTTNTVITTGSMDIGSGSMLRVMSLGTLNCQPSYILTGTDFDMQNFSRLIIGAVDGIAATPSATGNIQTTNRNYNATAQYTFQGINNQITGSGLPLNITGSLIINNLGTAPNNVVSLTTNGTNTSLLELNLGKFSIGAGQQLNMSASGNVLATSGDFTIGSAGGTLNFNGAGSLSGNMNPYNVSISGPVNFGVGTVTIQNAGTLRINSGGSVLSNAAFYASNANLQYNINGNFNRGLEWSAASGRGFPYHVQLSNNTVLNAAGTGGVNAALTLDLAGNLTIESGSSLAMNFAGNNMTVPLNVAGNIDFTGSLIASGVNGGNIALGGNWINNGAAMVNFTPNNRIVTFNGSGLQSITGTNTTINPFAQLTINNPAGVTLTSLDAEVQTSLNLTSGKLNLNNNQLTLGTIGNNGTLSGGSATSYIISGSTSAKFIRYTTTNATTYAFPIGDATNYSPISVQFYASPMAANTQLSVNIIASAHPNLGTSTNYLGRYWTVEPTNLPNIFTDYGVVYQYADADIIGVEANIKPYKHSTVGWIAAQGSGASFEMGTGSVNPGTNTITWTGLNNFSDFTGNGNGSPLPISLLDFNAQVVLGQVNLTWSTASEINNDYFTIERSKNGIDFKELAQVPAAGNSNQILNYKLIDEQPYQGLSYYRLKQTDFDGKFTFAQIKTVTINDNQKPDHISIYPNPSNINGIYLAWPEGYNDTQTYLQLIDLYGKVLYSDVYTLKNTTMPIFINFENIAVGIYTLQLTHNSETVKSFKLSITK
jgi:hypothetical protein